MDNNEEFSLSCPIPISDYPSILMAHGGGGRLMQQLIDKMFVRTFDNPHLGARHDSSVVQIGNRKLAFTTDSYVVKPLFFPGGDIGALAVNGTVNDLAMSGARPQYLSAGLIIEEGLRTEDLWRIVQSMHGAAEKAGVMLITGDTKVVDRGKGDGIFINTAGIGVIDHNLAIAPRSVQPGDVVLLNGDIGRHGMAIMAAREGIAFESTIESDCAPLWGLVDELLKSGIEIHCLRDLTRGGLASALVEIAEAADVHINIDERSIPVMENVEGACEILGFDPIYVANEGRIVAFLPEKDVDRAIKIIKSDPICAQGCVIGRVTGGRAGMVSMKTKIGSSRIVDMLSGEQLPRIC